MGIISRIFVLFMMMFLTDQAQGKTGPAKLTMNVGESRDYDFDQAAKIFVSRKGIIHLVNVSETKWKITALKSGVVALDIKYKGAESQSLYVDVKPRNLKVPIAKGDVFTPSSNSLRGRICKDGLWTNQTYSLRTKVELRDHHESEQIGVNPELGVNWKRGADPAVTLSTGFNPQHSDTKRTIVGDPEVLVKACDDVVVRAGGEDEVELRNDQGHVVSLWKNHGLEIKLQVQPLVQDRFQIPFTVALRTPSKGKGNYGLSDVTSSLNIDLNREVLAAIINIQSNSEASRGVSFLESVPLIGPFFRGSDKTLSHSKLFIWFSLKDSTSLGEALKSLE